MPNFNAECIVLKSINYKESDKIYTLYSKEYGKFIATGRGVRKVASRRGGNMDTLNHIVAGISESEKGFRYISEVQSMNTFKNLKDDLDTSAKGFYFAELVHRLTEDESPNQSVFNVLLKSLRLLDSQVMSAKVAVSFFELSLMQELGYGLTLDNCVMCSRKFDVTQPHYRLNFGLGGLVCGSCGPLGLELSGTEAAFLYNLSRGKVTRDQDLLERPMDLVKLHVKDILEGTTKTSQVFGTV